jgi:hypothetical protein
MSDETNYEAFYSRVRNLGLKPTAVPTVWQTLDEQQHFDVPDPATLDKEEQESYLKTLQEMRGL